MAGFPAEAKRLLTACIAANPTKPVYHCYLGDVLIGWGQVKEALAAYESAVRCDSPGAGAYYNRLGNSLMKENLFDLAADAFQKAIDCEAAMPFYLNLAAAYKALGKTGNPEFGTVMRIVRALGLTLSARPVATGQTSKRRRVA